MMRSLFSAVSGLKSNQTAMDIIGNNIANVNTIAYKTSRTIFQDIFSQTIASATAPTTTAGGSNAKQVGLGTTISTIGMNMTEGSTQSTSNPLDFAISGEGFFVIDQGGKYVYTRSGALQTDPNGYLVTANGDYVMAVAASTTDANTNGMPDNLENGADVMDTSTDPATPLFAKIQLLGDITDGTGTVVEHYSAYAVDSNGVITAVNSTGATVTIGRMVLSKFNNDTGLEKIGSSYYTDSQSSGAPNFGFAGDGTGTLDSGFLEMSNVDLSTELTNMIITQRGFQANSRVITTTDSMLEELINLKR
jgi:flagellar hook protein FlgE